MIVTSDAETSNRDEILKKHFSSAAKVSTLLPPYLYHFFFFWAFSTIICFILWKYGIGSHKKYFLHHMVDLSLCVEYEQMQQKRENIFLETE